MTPEQVQETCAAMQELRRLVSEAYRIPEWFTADTPFTRDQHRAIAALQHAATLERVLGRVSE